MTKHTVYPTGNPVTDRAALQAAIDSSSNGDSIILKAGFQMDVEGTVYRVVQKTPDDGQPLVLWPPSFEPLKEKDK